MSVGQAWNKTSAEHTTFYCFHFTETGLQRISSLDQLLRDIPSLLFPFILVKEEQDWIRSFSSSIHSSAQEKHTVCTVGERGILHDLLETDVRNSLEQGELQELTIVQFSWDTKTSFLTIVKSSKGATCDEHERNEDFDGLPQKGKRPHFSMLGHKNPNLPEEGNLQNHRQFLDGLETVIK